MAAATGTTKNTCEQAFDMLAKRPDTIFRGATGALELRRKIASPGQLSDGTRTFIIRPCERIRWLVVELGWKTLGEIDQRSFGHDPEAMAAAVMAVIDAASPQKAPASATAGFREELTTAGLQLVIPGCDRVPVADKHGAAQLSLF